MVKKEVCWVFRGELGVGLRSWLFWECRGGVGGAGDGYGCLKRKKVAGLRKWVFAMVWECILSVNSVLPPLEGKRKSWFSSEAATRVGMGRAVG